MIYQIRTEEVPVIAEMEKTCFPDPWSLTMLEECFCNRFDVCLVMEEDGQFIGYCIFRILSGEGELFRIAVLPQHRGKGYGRKLMEAMEEYAKEEEVTSIMLEVRESNEAAKKLYTAYGFEVEHIRKSYYSNPVEDGVVMCNRSISNFYH